jgi:integrase
VIEKRIENAVFGLSATPAKSLILRSAALENDRKYLISILFSAYENQRLAERTGQAPRVSVRAGAPVRPPKTRSHAHPARKEKKPTRISYLTSEELTALHKAVRARGRLRDVAIFEVAAGRGLRRSEVGLLLMEHLRLQFKKSWIERVKGGISHEHDLLDPEVRALKAWIRERGEAPGAVFLSSWGRPISGVHLNRLMRQYGTAAGLPENKLHFHCLRHTCATQLLEEGTAIELVQDHLGHSDIRNTMIYARVTDKRRTALAKLLNEKRRR